jgi:single-strand DNA-binding protein
MNSINLIGNICNDLEVKTTQSGKSVVSFNLAVKRPFTKDTTDFIPVVVWEQGAQYLSRYGKKGSRCAVGGKLTTRKYQDQNGNNRTAYEVIADTVELMDSKGENSASETRSAAGGNTQGGYMPQAYASGSAVGAGFVEIDSDEGLPF